ncbi:MAG: asparaginase domain-containing protein [Rhodothermales bacterium]
MHVKIFTTGGTIDKVYFDAQSEYAVGEPLIAEILRKAGVTVPYGIETLFRKDSLEPTAEDRALITRRMQEEESQHVLSTHGTDTMVETARALQHFKWKTVVLVGSLMPARFHDSDAVFNIGFAMAAVQTLPEGIHLAMNGRVFHPEHVRKNRTASRFESV